MSCFDGEQFINNTTEDGLAHNNVLAICEDRQGRLWFSTQGGVSCYDGQQFINYTTENGLAYNSVWAICEDRQGRLWFGTIGGGVCCFDGSSFTTYTTADGSVNEAEEMYQTERLLEVLRQSKPDLSAQEMMDLIIGDVHTFVGNVESYDDITVVVVRVI